MFQVFKINIIHDEIGVVIVLIGIWVGVISINLPIIVGRVVAVRLCSVGIVNVGVVAAVTAATAAGTAGAAVALDCDWCDVFLRGTRFQFMLQRLFHIR